MLASPQGAQRKVSAAIRIVRSVAIVEDVPGELVGRAEEKVGQAFGDATGVVIADGELQAFATYGRTCHTQEEIAAAIGVSQQRVSQRLRTALAACWEASAVSFRRVLWRTVDRRQWPAAWQAAS
jgi:hypothetical protein